MDCIVQPQTTLWTGAIPHGLPSYHQRNFFPNIYFQRKRSFNSPYYSGPSLFFPHDDDVDYPTDMKGELTTTTMSYHGMIDDIGEVKLCVVCGERASGFYFGALVCLPCKSFYIRCTKDGEPTFTCQCSGNCDIIKQGRIRCQYCRYQRCLMAGMCRKEKPETVQPAEGQVLCKVCGDIANGIHFGVNTCEGCKKFFRRGLVENQSYICKGEKECAINPRNRNNCRYCRYQKCLSVGMSREAIKMGRPKKGDGCDGSVMTSGQKTTRMAVLDVDNIDQSVSTNPRLGDDNNNCDSLKTSSVQDKVKEEETRTSCDYNRKCSTMWNQGNRSQVSSSWQPCNDNDNVQNPASNRMPASEFIEEEMDEILMMLQNDNHSGSPAKKMRCYGYGEMVSQKICKTEYDAGMQGQQWNMNETPCSSSMSSHNIPLNEPMNMSTNHMNPMANRPPPPQYPGFTESSFLPDQQNLCMSASPCHSPNSQMHSPRSYISDSGMPSPGYIPNGSPVHSSSCQYSPQHSPVYPQSPYQNEISPQGSPYTEPIYNTQPYSPHDSYQVTDLSSSPQHSSQFTSQMTQLSNTSNTMTIPHQEGGVNSHDSWCLSGPSSFFCHSPSSTTNVMTIPNQEGTYRRSSPRKENLQRINHCFLSHSSCDLQLIPDTDLDGSMTRSDIEEEVVHKTLASVSPAESFYYVMSDHHSTSSDSNCSTNYDEFTSCRRINKRKSCDNLDTYGMMRTTGTRVGRYQQNLTERYWHMSAHQEEPSTMSAGKQALLEHLNKIFQQMTDKCTKPVQHIASQDGNTWQQIQIRIIRNTSAAVQFASQIPGFSRLHPEDKSFLCKSVSFMSTLLMAGQHLYNPKEKNFEDFWNWQISPQNPFYAFKEYLVKVGDKIHAAHMDRYEVSALAALLFLASDFTDLAYPEAIEEARRRVIAALKSYEMSKGVDVKSRMSELFHLIPDVRHVGVWHQQLMKQMKINVQKEEVQQLYEAVNFRES